MRWEEGGGRRDGLIFGKVPKEGGRGIFNPKIDIADYGTL